nr:unnamed protein product [Digitaria exilis]
MAAITRSTAFLALAAAVLAVLAGGTTAQQLSPTFYSTTCPKLSTIVRSAMAVAVRKEKRMGASILRMFFHDCFVNGCDGSILLDDTPSFTGEKGAGPNFMSVRGYEVIDTIKTQVEASCNATVSCADILALAARDGGAGPNFMSVRGYEVIDTIKTQVEASCNATVSCADILALAARSSLATLITMFGNKNLTARDMTALSGAHTIGRAQCQFFRSRVYTERNINATFAKQRRRGCPKSGNDTLVSPFDVQTADVFDNAYYQNLVAQEGLLHSDQELFNGGSQDALVKMYSNNGAQFFADFVAAMVKMGNLMPSSGTPTEVRLNCRKVN